MKFLIIGASGFIGRHIMAHVKAMGYEALGTQSRLSKSGLIPFNLLEDRIGDRIDPSFWTSSEPVVSVICAAISQIDRCLLEKETSYKVNVENTIRLIDDLRDYGSKPVFLSTSFVFDGRDGYYPDSYPHSPICEYGRQKSEVETYLVSNVPESFVLRLDKIVGDDPSENHLFTEWYQWITDGKPVVCMEGQWFSPTFVVDVARSIQLGCERKLAGCFNVANSECFSRDDLARQFVRFLGKRAEIICRTQQELGFADMRPAKSYLNSTKFINAIGMQFTSMHEVFERFSRRVRFS